MLSCSTWPLMTPPHPSEDSQEPLANPADEMKIFHLSLPKPLSDNNSGTPDCPAEKSINKRAEHTYIWVAVLIVDLYLQLCSFLAFYFIQLRYIALMWLYRLESQFIPCDCLSWWAQNPSSDNGIHLHLYIACICYLLPSSNKSNLVSLIWTTDHCKLVKESGQSSSHINAHHDYGEIKCPMFSSLYPWSLGQMYYVHHCYNDIRNLILYPSRWSY